MFKNVVKAIRNEWNQQLTECYPEIIKQIDIEIKLEKLILNRNNQMNYSHICFLPYLTENTYLAFQKNSIIWYAFVIRHTRMTAN